MVDTVEALVDGGRASAGPPLGPALGPKGVNIGQVIAKINERTKAFDGMKVPVKILINDDKSFDIKVGTPPMSALIKSELGLDLDRLGDRQRSQTCRSPRRSRSQR